MARSTLIYGGKDLNDGAIWCLMPGADFGERVKTYDEHLSYTGNVAQHNVTEAHLIPMSIPLRLQGSDVSEMRAEVDALNALIDAGEQDLVYDDGSGAITYSCAASPRISYPRTTVTKTCLAAFIDFEPVRYP